MGVEYMLVQDDDSHWYVIPSYHIADWENFRATITSYWDDMPEGIDEPDLPDWAEELGGGPSSVTFEKYTIH